MRFLSAVDALIGAFGSEESRASRETARAAFELRTGAFRPEDPWFEARSRAFIDDALTQESVLSGLCARLPEEAQAWLPAFGRAHRGLFEVQEDDGDVLLVRDLVSGVELFVTDLDESTAIALDAARGLFDARLVGFAEPAGIGALPGPVFHVEEATPLIKDVLLAAREQGLSSTDTLDALLRMEHKHRSLSRMKPTYAYKKEALARTPVTPHEGSGPHDAKGVLLLRSRLTKRADSESKG
jgi:hypothetical protein